MNPNPWIKISERMPMQSSRIELWDSLINVVFSGWLDHDNNIYLFGETGCLTKSKSDQASYSHWRLPEPEEEWPR